MGNLYLMMGAPGCGKSTWCREHINFLTEKYVSRDDIRFSLVKEGEPYFSKEKQVMKTYIDTINKFLFNGYTVFADATHVSRFARRNILNKIKEKPDEIGVIYIKQPLKVILKRNSTRGGRLKVPEDVVKRMYDQIEVPDFEEGIDVIYIVEDNKPIQVIRKEK